MKKTQKSVKFSLRKDTIAVLNQVSLDNVVGGGTVTCTTTQARNCFSRHVPGECF